MSDLAASIVIPSFERPTWLEQALRALAKQTVAPIEVLVVARASDEPTLRTMKRLMREEWPFALRLEHVTEAGFMPPVERGIAAARGDIIIILDDDAKAHPELTERMLLQYSDPSIGAVGGRVINCTPDDVPVEKSSASRVGYVTAFGRFVGDMYRNPTFSEATDVLFLMGCCTSFRREVARHLEFDRALNREVASGYEIDLGLQVHAMGYRLRFDPCISILHYCAPRAHAGDRVLQDERAARWRSYNETRVVLRRLPVWQRALFLAWALPFGTRRSPGLLPWVLSPLAQRAGFVAAVAKASCVGRLEALFDVAVGA